MESTDSFCNHTNDKQDLLNQEYDYQTKQNIHALTRDDATVLLHCPTITEIKTVDSQLDLRILL